MLLSHLTITDGYTSTSSVTLEPLQISITLLLTTVITIVPTLNYSKPTRTHPPISTTLLKVTANVSLTTKHVSTTAADVESPDELATAILSHEQYNAE